jgi:mannose-6-phosphate isomerase-like protein (cupin superfamily)
MKPLPNASEFRGIVSLLFFFTNILAQFSSLVVQAPFRSNALAEKLNIKAAQNSIPAADLDLDICAPLLLMPSHGQARSPGPYRSAKLRIHREHEIMTLNREHTMEETGAVRNPFVVSPDGGRVYAMGQIRAIFKADSDESAGRYSVSEWWLEPRTRGPGVHAHPDDHVFYVIAGTLSLRLNDDWSQVTKGSYAVIPGGTPHDFENRGSVPSGFISFNAPGGFEAKMTSIAPALASADLRL